jgi:hypothetical protein
MSQAVMLVLGMAMGRASATSIMSNSSKVGAGEMAPWEE